MIILAFRFDIKEFLKDKGKTIPLLGPYIQRFPWKKFTQYDKNEVFSLQWPQRTPFCEGKKTSTPEGFIAELTVQHWFEKNDVNNHPNRADFFQARSGLPKMLIIEEGDDSKKSFKRLHRWRYSPTACYGNNEVHLHPCFPRRISVAEALSVQSLPIEFELPADMSLTNKFRLIGNGVPYLAAKGLAKSIKSFVN